MSRLGKMILWFVVGLFLFIYLAFEALPPIAGFMVDYWWFESLNLHEVFLTRLGAALLLGLIGFLAGLAVFGWLLARMRAAFVATGRVWNPAGRWLSYLAVLGAAGVAARALASHAETLLLWQKHASFAQTEPLFNKPYDFFVFTLPFFEMWGDFLFGLIASSLMTIGIVAFVVSQQRSGAMARMAQPIEKHPQFKFITLSIGALVAIPFLAGFLMAAGFGDVSFLLALMIVGAFLYWWHRRYGSTRFTIGWAKPPGAGGGDPVRQHLKKTAGVLFGLLLLDLAYSEWLGRYDLVRDGSSDIISSASWLDGAYLAKALVIVPIGLLMWGLVLLFGRLSTSRHFLIAGSLVGLFSVVFGLVPGLIRSVYVQPNELLLEEPWIARHIDATRFAYNLDLIDERSYEPHTDLTEADLTQAVDTLANIRIWDYRAFDTANDQLQSLQTYYSFDDADVDRYLIGGELRQVMVSARELHLEQLPPTAADQWLLPFAYTHSYGLIAALANEATDQGRPAYLLKDIPPTAAAPSLRVADPRMYFGEASRSGLFLHSGIPEVDPSVSAQSETNAANPFLDVTMESVVPTVPPADEKVLRVEEESVANAAKLDVLSEPALAGVAVPDDGFEHVGIPMTSFGRRLIFAFHNGFSANTFFSKYLSSETEYVLNRTLLTRLEKLAPFIHWDKDPYPVIRENGAIVWVVDGYTTADSIPFATFGGDQEYNYFKNSVKATVDALTGETHLYLWDTSDPLIESWQKIYPSLFADLAEVPDDLLAHFRFPVQGFEVQTAMFNRYHVTDPFTFYSREDVWRTPDEVIHQSQAGTPMEAYYNIVNLPGSEHTNAGEYVLLRPATPFAKENMTAWYAGQSDWPSTGRLLVYQIPTTSLISGPSQIATRIDQDPELSKNFSLWNQEGSQVIRGGMYVLPVGNAFLYVQPIYLQARSNPIPELQLVVLATENQLVFAPTVKEALHKLVVSR